MVSSSGVSVENNRFLFAVRKCTRSDRTVDCLGSVTNKAAKRRKMQIDGYSVYATDDLGNPYRKGEITLGARGWHQDIEPELEMTLTLPNKCRELQSSASLPGPRHPRFWKRRWWNINIDRSMSKSQFLRYAGRYVRRPPIAQHRFVEITDGTVRFWTKDLKLKRRVITEYSLGKFVAALAEHIPDRYRHAIRYFGLLAPRSKNQTSAAAFVLLGQQKRPRPRRLGWAGSLQNCFGVNPLIDNSGHPMCWVRRLGPATQSM